MAKFFKNIKKHKSRSRGRRETKPIGPVMDPVLFQGGLDPVKYPPLPLGDKSIKEVETENPLNKR